MSLSESEIYMVISWRLYAGIKAYRFNRHCFQQRWRIELCSGLKTGHGCVRQRFHQTSLIWLILGRDVPCGIRDIPGTMWRPSRSSSIVVGTGVAASSSVCYWMTARTLNADLPYFLCHSRKWSAAYTHPGWVNSSSFICFRRNLSRRCCTIFAIVPITQPGSSSSLSWHSSVSSSSSSSPSSPSSELARSLRLPPIATIISWNQFSGSSSVNPTFSAFLVSSCSCWTAASASWTWFLAPAVSLSK